MTQRTTRRFIPPAAFLLLLALLIASRPAPVRGWGADGHAMAGRAAALKLPNEMPKFFRAAADQLSYLNPEPDRWRDRVESNLDRAMDSAAAPDHFLDLELVPPSAMKALNRYDFVAELIKAGQPPTKPGFAPYRVLELFQRIRVEFRLWRAETDGKKRKWIEQRILNDAGVLGHYVTDLSNPHHTTIHFNGWSGDNPNGYAVFTREPNQGIHYRFEEEYVRTHIQLNDILPLVGEGRVIDKPREEIWTWLRDSNKLVEPLYILDKQEKFNAATQSAEHKRFVSQRLAVGAQMLRDLWWTAWKTSEPVAAPDAPRKN
ncbi:MAG: nuclease [Blastocatellia bacterium]|nr:nuclease [Blastocatellia bacterium]